MKTQTILPILFAVTVILLTLYNSKQTADNYLKDDNQPKEIVLAMAHHLPHMSEKMNKTMNNNSCKQMMMDNMWHEPSVKNMHMDNMISKSQTDTSMFKMLMYKTIGMCDTYPVKCRMILVAMQSQPKCDEFHERNVRYETHEKINSLKYQSIKTQNFKI